MVTAAQLNQVMGYGATPNPAIATLLTQRPELDPVLTEIFDALTEIDEQLNAARADSMAVKVGELEVSYQNHVIHLRREGSRLLRQLEALTEVAVRFDKYSGNASSVVSYW